MRNIKTRSIILHASPTGDYHKRITGISPKLGIYYATAYGGYKSKSKLVSSAEPFNSVICYLYHNPVKDQYKITDLEVVDGFDEIRTSVEKILAATFISEILTRSHREESRDVFPLTLSALSNLNSAPYPRIEYVLIQFLFRYLQFSGYFAVPDTCEQCNRPLKDVSSLFWTGLEGEYVCDNCNHPGDIEVTAGGMRYLEQSTAVPFERGCAIITDNRIRSAIKNFAQELIRESLGITLRTPWP